MIRKYNAICKCARLFFNVIYLFGRNFCQPHLFAVLPQTVVTQGTGGSEERSFLVKHSPPTAGSDDNTPYRHRAFKKEAFFYSTLAPLINDLLKKEGVVLPCFGILVLMHVFMKMQLRFSVYVCNMHFELTEHKISIVSEVYKNRHIRTKTGTYHCSWDQLLHVLTIGQFYLQMNKISHRKCDFLFQFYITVSINRIWVK